MKTIIILSALAVIFLLTFVLVKSAQYISKRFAVKLERAGRIFQ